MVIITCQRPMALTPTVMKVCERLMLNKLVVLIKEFTNPLQFAHQENRGFVGAVLYTLNNIYSHLENPENSIRMMCFVFSSAFNIIQPHLTVQKLGD